MKPIKLTLTNIGPFVGTHEIDFSQLENIYVITGKTGSGKTTILDAITYALYGKLPGSRKDVNNMFLRSQFCQPNDNCSIMLEFSIQGKIYRIERTLPTERINNKGKLTIDPELVLLFDITETETLISNQIATVKIHIQDLLKLTSDEFSKIVLLPQGEFSTFLKQNSSNRKEILAKLFPVDQFKKIIEKTKQNKDFYTQNLNAINKRLEQIMSNFNPETVETDIQNLNESLQNEKQNLQNIQKTIEKLIIEQEKLEAIAQKQKQLSNAKDKLEKLELEKSLIDEQEKQLHIAQEIDKILPLVRIYEEHTNRFETTTKDLEECAKQLANIYEEQQNIQEQEKDKTQWDSQITENTKIIEKLKTAVEFEKSIKQNKQQKQNILNKKQSFLQKIETIQNALKNQEEILEAENETQNTLEEYSCREKIIQHEILLCEKNIDSLTLKKEKENVKTEQEFLLALKNQLEEQKTANMAQAIAQHLIDGCPCPVCGSTVHPTITHSTDIDTELEQKIAAQEIKVTLAEENQLKIEKKLNVIDARIEVSKNSLNEETIQPMDCSTKDDWQHHKVTCEQNLLTIQQSVIEIQNKYSLIANAKTKKAEFEKELDPLKTNLNAIELELSGFEARIDQTTEQLNKSLQKIEIKNTVQETIEIVENQQANLLQTITAFETKKNKITTEYATFTEKKVMLEKSLEEHKINAEKSFTELLLSVKKSKFYTEGDFSNTLDFIKKSFIDDVEKDRIQKRIELYTTERKNVQVLISTLETEITNTDKNITAQQQINVEQRGKAEQLRNELQESIGKIQESISSITKDFNVYKQEMKTFEAEKKLCEQYTNLYKTISSENSKKISLDAWVLSMHLKDITELANTRLKKLSNERYELQLVKEETKGNAHRGLDLEIFDQFTGKARPTCSLSGGETFMTAICLALAISDLVQQQNGGIQLDSLFIDEGFGSLDPESLEAAINILDEIRETRSIGLISHVEMLQSRIPSQICVTKTNIGSTVKVI